MSRDLQALLDAYAAPGIRFEVHGIDPPDRLSQSITELRCAGLAIRNAIEAQRRGCAAFVFGHFQEPGLIEARTAVDIPVLGLGETTMLHALTLGHTFGLVTINPVFVPWLRDQIVRLGLTQQSAGVRALDTEVETYMRAYEDPAACRDVKEHSRAKPWRSSRQARK